MAGSAGSLATNVAQRFITGSKIHLENFEKKKEQLDAIGSEVLKYIEDAEGKNETQVDDVQHQLNEIDVIISEDMETRKKWFHAWCPDRIWKYLYGKKLAKKVQDIERLSRGSCNFHGVARQAKIPVIKYSQPYVIDFESRKSRFEELVEALESKYYTMIGLHGSGGIGKTTLALQVGVHVEESKAFKKVIFISVSNPPNIKKIQSDIAMHLDLLLGDIKEAERSIILGARIANVTERVLIILDDVQSVLNLEYVGIPSGNDEMKCCVLVTTRHVEVCRAMRCQLTIQLQTLTNQEAFNLFMKHANDDDSTGGDLNGVAKDIVKECGGIPIAIVAMARTIRNWTVAEQKAALTTLQNSQPWVDVDENLMNVYKCLKLSYDNLRNEKAKKLFLLCSLLPKDYEIPISLLISLSTGAGIFGEVDKYCEARSRLLVVKNELIDSSLLLKVEQGVKMPGLVREVAWWMAKEDTQVIMNSKVTPKSNLRFLFWSGDDFPNQFHGMKLEVLLLWIKGCVKGENASAIFKEMQSLRVLVLNCDVENCLRLSLQSFLLKNIVTLILNGWKLDNISGLKNIPSLETLELNYCSITELPEEIEELKNLKLLGLRGCSIGRNNPFEVIERCSQLEELYFLGNDYVKESKPKSNKLNIDEVSQDIPPAVLQLQMYSIACSGRENLDYFDNDLLKCFSTTNVKNLISGAQFRYLVEKAEVLEYWGMEETGWRRSLVPDIIHSKGGVMNDLIKLCLYEWDSIEYLVDAKELVYSDVTVFARLVELYMRDVEVKELCRGPMPSGFLEQLEVLNLSSCMKLRNIFFDGSLKLPNLNVLKLKHCPMIQPFIFKPSVARSLVRLEELVIEDCYKLSCLIGHESLKEVVDGDYQNSYDRLFPRLQTLKINGCEKLKVLFPLLLVGDLPLLQDLSIRYCAQLRFIFDEYRHEGQFLPSHTILPSLTTIELYFVPSLINILGECNKCMQRLPPIVKHDSKETHANSNTQASPWARGCCFWGPTTQTDIAVSKSKMQQQTTSLESPVSRKGIQILFPYECFFRLPFGFQNIRHMKLWEFSNLRSLFSVPIAATIMLEKLEISYCEELKHIITNEGEEYDRMNYSSIFPKLQVLNIYSCNKLDFIFPSTFSGGLQKLQHMTITRAFELKHVFGKYHNEDYVSEDIENNEFHIDLPVLKTLSLEDVPNMISIGINNCHLKYLSLQNLDEVKATKIHMQNMTSEGAKKSEIEEIINIERPVTPRVGLKYGLNFHNLQQITVTGSPRLKTMFSSSTWRSLPQLSKLCISECGELSNVVEDDSKDHGHINYISIFPKLEDLEIRRCMNLEFIFPSPVSGSLPKLKHLVVREAAKLKHIFGKYYEEDYLTNENESDEVQVDLSALETLLLTEVPSMTNICAKKRNILRLPSLRNIALDNCQKLSAKPFPNLTFFWKPAAAKDLMRLIMHQQKLTSLEVEESIIEEVFNFEENVEVEGPVGLNLEFMRLKHLGELRHICRGVKCILSLLNLSKLEIESCGKLRVVFSASMSKSLPQLSHLRIKDCPELVQLIEEDDEENSADDHLQQHRFPKLQYIVIEHCNRLKCLFSISTFRMLPTLQSLQVVDALKLEQVFTSKQDDLQKMAVKDVFPILSRLILKGLPRLVTVCGSTNFQTVQYVEVFDCPRFKGPQYGDSENEAATEELPSAQKMPHMRGTSASRNSTESSKEATAMSVVEEVPISKISSATSKETLMKIEAKGSIPASQKQGIKALPVDSQLRTPSTHGAVESSGDRDTEKEVGKVVPALKLTTSPKVSSMAETVEQGYQEHDGSMEGMITRKQSGVLLDTYLGNELFEQVGQGNKETMKQGIQEDYALERDVGTASSDLTKQSAETFLRSQDFPQRTEASKVNLSGDDISSLHCQSHIDGAGPSPSMLEIGEILELVELKDDERALLVKALELYPKLRLSGRSRPIIAFAYRVLVDILIMINAKTPCTITEADKSTLEANLGAANFFGFDKDWVESVRTKVFDIDMFDILATREKILDMEAEIETDDIALEHMRKERAEAKERLAMARRQLDLARSEFEAIDSQLLGLLKNGHQLTTKEESGEISAKDGPLGI